MAMPGWLGQDVQGSAQGPRLGGAAGVPAGGISYGDILKTALQYGSKPGSSGPMIAGALPGGVAPATAPGVAAPGVAGPQEALLAPAPPQQSSLGALLGIFGAMLGV